MKISVVPSDVPSCEFYRSRFAAEALDRKGEIQFTALPRGELGSGREPLRIRYAIRRGPGGEETREPIKIIDPPDTDVLVLTRGVFAGRVVEIIPLLQAEGIAVVLDIDDDYEHLPPSLTSLYKISPNLNPGYNWANVKRACKLADGVTVSTPLLRRYAENSVVVRNCIPEHYFKIRGRRDETPTVGWGGTIYGHPGDLHMPGAGVREAITEVDGRFLNIGDGEGVRLQLSLDRDPETTGIVSFEQYPKDLARLDVAIAPLELGVYSHAKSALKMLESLALRSQVVGSPTDEYTALQAEVDEWCAERELPVPSAVAKHRTRSWRKALLNALQRPEDERQAACDAGREFVRERYNVEDRCYQWADAWESALQRRRSA